MVDMRTGERVAVKSEKFHQQVLNVSSLVFIHVVDRQIIWINESIKEMFGYSPDECEQQSISFIYSSNAEHERVDSIIDDCLKKKEPSTY